MINNMEARKIIKASGIHQNKVAEITKINKGWLSEFLCGKRIFDTERQNRLDECLMKIQSFSETVNN